MFRPEPDKNSFPVRPGITVHTLRSGYGVLSPLLSHQTGYPLLKDDKIR